MYVAQKRLKQVDRKNKVTWIEPGDEVVGFDKWAVVTQRAHLNMDYVREVKGGPERAKANKAKPKG